jgi:hypothetical protein
VLGLGPHAAPGGRQRAIPATLASGVSSCLLAGCKDCVMDRGHIGRNVARTDHGDQHQQRATSESGAAVLQGH